MNIYKNIVDLRRQKLGSIYTVIIFGLFLLLFPGATAKADVWSFAWSQGGQNGSHSFSSLSACNDGRSNWVNTMRSMGESARAGSCSRIGGSTSTNQPRRQANRPQTPSGPSAAERSHLQQARQQESTLKANNARQREIDRQRAFDSDKADLMASLSNPDVETIEGNDTLAFNSPAMRQLVCSAARSTQAIAFYNTGEYEKAVMLGRASVGEVQAADLCVVGGFIIPNVPEPVAEVNFTQGMKRYQKIEDEVTQTIQKLSIAEIDMTKAKKATTRREKQIDRQETLITRLKSTPESEGKKAGLDKANDLLAKAKAMLAKEIDEEDAADQRLRVLAVDRERLCTISNDLSDTLKQERNACIEEQGDD